MRKTTFIAGGLLVLHAALLPLPVAAEAAITVVAAEFPPLTTNAGGRPSGVVLDILREAGKKAGIPLTFRFLPWLRAQREVLDQSDLLIIPFTRTPDREPHFQWIAPILAFDTVLVTVAEPPASLEEARKLVVGYVSGTSFKDEAERAGFTRVEESIDDVTNARKLTYGRIGAWITTDLMAPGVYRLAGFNPADLKYGLKLGPTKISYVAAGPGFPKETARKIADTIDKMKADGSWLEIVNRYRDPYQFHAESPASKKRSSQ